MICRAMGLLVNIGSKRIFLAEILDIAIRLPRTYTLKILLEAFGSHPVFQQVGNATTGQGSTSQAIHLVLGIGIVLAHRAFDQMNLGRAALFQVIDFLTRPLSFPVGVIHFSTQAGCFSMLVETQADDRIGIPLQCNEAIQGRPESVTTHRQDDPIELTVLFNGINSGITFTTLDALKILTTGKSFGKLRVFRGFKLIVLDGGVDADHGRFDVLTGFQVNNPRGNEIELLLNLLRRHLTTDEVRGTQDIFLNVQLAVTELGWFQQNRGTGDNDRTDRTKRQSNNASSERTILTQPRHGPASSC